MNKAAIVRVCVIVALFAALCVGYSCKHEPGQPPADSGYPASVASIIVNKCAIAGCHNTASYQNSDGLLLDTWDHMFNGGSNGAVVVPYSTQFSSLLFCCNTDSTLGPVMLPTMPENATPLNHDEYMTLYNWIASGAPDKNGNVPFASNADTRQKIYLTQQGCDLLAVIDAERKVVMRYIPVGKDPSAIESPHCVRVSDDGLHAYVSFINGNYIQQIDTRTDEITWSVNVGSLVPGGSGGSWNILHLSPLDTALVTSDWQSDGIFATINIPGSQIEAGKTLEGSSVLVYPHGIASNPSFDTFFITAQYGNMLYEYSGNGPFYKRVSLDGLTPATSATTDSSKPNPHEILMAPDFSKYFVTCQSTNEVRVLDAHTNAIIAAIPVGLFPQEMAISKTHPYLFVTCQEDVSSLTGRKGSVYVINYNTLQVVQQIDGDFYQPHGVTVDDPDGLVWIASTNANPNGPAPHHVTSCGGRDGWYTVYNLSTLQPTDNKRYEVTVMPYSAAVRFK